MDRFFPGESMVKNASWKSVFLWLITGGTKGRLYVVIKNPPPEHFNCRCKIK